MGSKDNEAKYFLPKKKIKLYPIVFKWEGEAEKVYLTGSFCDWINFYEMKKNKIKKNFISLFFFKKELININTKQILYGNAIVIIQHVTMKMEI